MSTLEERKKAKLPGEDTGIYTRNSFCDVCAPGPHCGVTCYVKDGTIIKVEGGIMAAGSVSAILDKDPDPEHLLRTVMSDFDIRILESSSVEYKCYCSRERVERALISLGVEELEGILREQGSCQLTCQFCDEVYDFSGEELQKLIDDLKK